MTIPTLQQALLPPEAPPLPENDSIRQGDAGAAFVLESKGEWYHAGFHLTTAIVGPTILTLPYAFRGLGWGLGFFSLTVMGVVTFYSYYLMSLVLEHCEKAGRRHIRFRELASDVLGSGWMYYFVIFIQTAINTGISIGAILLAGKCLQIMYSSISPDGPLHLWQFIAMVTVVMMVLSQLPTFHSLRHVNLASLFLSLAYTFIVVGACIHAGLSKDAPARDYSLESSKFSMVMSAFTSISIIAAIFGNGIVPEIQATLAPPVTGKMFKGLMMCYSVIFVTFYSAAVSGYYVFGNKASSNILKSLLPDEGPALAPTWLLGLGVIFVLLQLFAIGLVYSQVAYEIMETKSADVNQGMFSKRNLIPRIILRSLYMIFCGFFAAMLPFFGDINGVVGALGFIPLDFILPMLQGFTPLLRRGGSCRLELPENWCNDFTGFLMCIGTSYAFSVTGCDISMKQESGMDFENDGVWEESDGGRHTLVWYVSFGSLRHTTWWYQTHNAVSLKFESDFGCTFGFGVRLVEKKSRSGQTETSTDSSSHYTPKIKIQHDSTSELKVSLYPYLYWW